MERLPVERFCMAANLLIIPDIVSLPVLWVLRKTTFFWISHFSASSLGKVVGLKSAKKGGVVKPTPNRGRFGRSVAFWMGENERFFDDSMILSRNI